jgi:hypothetical protein
VRARAFSTHIVQHFKGEFDDETENRNWCVKDLGTVTNDGARVRACIMCSWLDFSSLTAECAFRYAFRPKAEYDLEQAKMSSVPFQLQVCACVRVYAYTLSHLRTQQLLYTRKDGSLRLRVATTRLDTTADRGEAEQVCCDVFEMRMMHIFCVTSNPPPPPHAPSHRVLTSPS